LVDLAQLFIELPSVPLPGPRPVFGARANHLRFFMNPVATMLRLHAKFGPIVGLSRDDPSLICAFGPRFNHQLLANAGLFPNFAESPLRPPPGSAAAKFNAMLIAQNGEQHRRNRRLMMPAFSKARLADYGREIAELGARELGSWPTEAVIDVKARAIALSLRVSLRCLFGLDVGGNGSELARVALEYLSLLTSPGAMLLPFDLPGLPYARYLRTCDRMAAMILDVLERKREQGLGDDMLSALVASTDEDGGFSADELIAQVGLLLTAGHETTAMTLSWTLLLLAAHPEVQAALAEEIASCCRGAPPTLDDLDRLDLLDRVVREAMRLLPAASMLFFRRATAPFELDGHPLPAGTTVVLSPLITHRDPDRYPEPLRFDPDRWRTLEPTTYEYLPFGAGPRRCLGAGFATNSTRLLLASILQRVRVAIPPRATVDVGVSGLVMAPRGELRLRVLPPGASLGRPEPLRGTLAELISLA
jgi:cytochrome P450